MRSHHNLNFLFPFSWTSSDLSCHACFQFTSVPDRIPSCVVNYYYPKDVHPREIPHPPSSPSEFFHCVPGTPDLWSIGSLHVYLPSFPHLNWNLVCPLLIPFPLVSLHWRLFSFLSCPMRGSKCPPCFSLPHLSFFSILTPNPNLLSPYEAQLHHPLALSEAVFYWLLDQLFTQDFNSLIIVSTCRDHVYSFLSFSSQKVA